MMDQPSWIRLAVSQNEEYWLQNKICWRIICSGHVLHDDLFRRDCFLHPDKICTASCTYVHFLSLCHLYPFWLLEECKWELSKDTFLTHAILLTTLHLNILFCKGLEMMGSDKIHTASHAYIHVLSSSHNFTPKRNELRYHCCLSQLYFIGH